MEKETKEKNRQETYKKAIFKQTLVNVVLLDFSILFWTLIICDKNRVWALFIALSCTLLFISAMIYTLKHLKRKYCKKCGGKYFFDSDVKWTETERIKKDNITISKVAFICTCHNCDSVFSFSKNFVIEKIERNGKVLKCGLEKQVETYIK